MRITIEVDTELLAEAKLLFKLSSDAEALDVALRTMVMDERSRTLGAASSKIRGTSSWKKTVSRLKKKQ